MTMPTVRALAEHALHIEEQERRIEALQEIIRQQADDLSRLRGMSLPLLARVHGGQRR